MAQTAAYELTGQNIRVNAICPGLIQTDMTKLAFDYARATGKEHRMGTLNPLLRQGLPHEVAELAVWLSSDESSYVNGQALSVDGGLTGSMPYIRAKM
jgi:NAD(P)-dependent dehydrogenase (short-subunit alcohol dehydrogenase family)